MNSHETFSSSVKLRLQILIRESIEFICRNISIMIVRLKIKKVSMAIMILKLMLMNLFYPRGIKILRIIRRPLDRLDRIPPSMKVIRRRDFSKIILPSINNRIAL